MAPSSVISSLRKLRQPKQILKDLFSQHCFVDCKTSPRLSIGMGATRQWLYFNFWVNLSFKILNTGCLLTTEYFYTAVGLLLNSWGLLPPLFELTIKIQCVKGLRSASVRNNPVWFIATLRHPPPTRGLQRGVRLPPNTLRHENRFPLSTTHESHTLKRHTFLCKHGEHANAHTHITVYLWKIPEFPSDPGPHLM